MTATVLSDVVPLVAYELIRSRYPREAQTLALKRLQDTGFWAAFLRLEGEVLRWAYDPAYICPAALDALKSTTLSALIDTMPIRREHETLFSETMVSGHAVFVHMTKAWVRENFAANFQWLGEEIIQLWHAGELIAAPVRGDGRILGLLLVWAGSLSEADCPAAELLGSLLGAALDRPPLRPASRVAAARAREAAYTLQSIVAALPMEQPVEQSLMTVRNAVPSLLPDVMAPFFAFPDQEKEGSRWNLLFADWAAPIIERFPGANLPRPISLGLGPDAWQTLSQGKPILGEAATVYAEQALGAELVQALRADLGVRCIAVFGLAFASEVLGVMFICSRKAQIPESGLDALAIGAGQIAIALHNAQEFHKQHSRLERLHKLVDGAGDILLPGSPEQRNRAIVSQAMRLLDADAAALFGIVPGGALQPLAYKGVSAQYVRAVCENYARLPAERVARTYLPDRVDDMANDPRVAPVRQMILEEGIRSMLVLPLVIRITRKGILMVYRRQPVPFSDEEVLVGSAYASLSALSGENLRLIMESHRLLEETEVLRQVLQELTEQRSLEDTARTILTNAFRLTGSDGGTLYLWDEARQGLVGRFGLYHNEIVRDLFLKPGQGVAGTTFVQGSPFSVEDYYQWSGGVTRGPRRPVAPVAGVPIWLRGQIIGVITLMRDVPKPPYSDEELDLMAALADEVAVAVANTQLAEERNRERQLTEHLLEGAPGILVVTDAEGKIVSVSRRFLEITGWTRNELLGRSWIEMCIPPEWRERIVQRLATVREQTAREKGVSPVLGKDGREIVVEWFASVLTDEEGHVTHLLGSGHPLED